VTRLIYTIIALLSIGFTNPVQSQRLDWRNRIDDVVRQADSLALKTQKTFHSLRYLNKDEAVKETWYYTLKDGKIVIFQLRYNLDDTEFNEVYYLHRGNLVCMEQYESPVKLSDEEIRRAEVYYFVGNAMMQYVHYGRQPKGYVYRPGYDCLEKFQKRYDELLRNMTLDPDYSRER
jgi:hypothetical protein